MKNKSSIFPILMILVSSIFISFFLQKIISFAIFSNMELTYESFYSYGYGGNIGVIKKGISDIGFFLLGPLFLVVFTFSLLITSHNFSSNFIFYIIDISLLILFSVLNYFYIKLIVKKHKISKGYKYAWLFLGSLIWFTIGGVFSDFNLGAV